MVKKINYFRNLQELRGMSACLIVISHIPLVGITIGTSLGGYGVTMFFLLSGFLLIHSTEKSTSFFLEKRIIRIIPMYYLITLVTYVMASIQPEWFNTTVATPQNLIKSLLFIPYMNPNGNVRPILDVAWALFPEVWFYIVFYISLKISYKHRALITGGCFMTLFGIGMAVENPILNQFKEAFLTLSIGMFLYYIWKWVPAVKINTKSWVPKFILVAMYFIIGILYNNLIYAKKRFLAIILAYFVFCIFVVLEGKIRESNILFKLGRISYSLYLTHEFIVKGVSRLVYSLDELNVISFGVSVLCVFFAIGVAIALNKIIEKPVTVAMTKILVNKKVK